MKLKKQIGIFISLSLWCTSVFAVADTVVKTDMTPPAAEGPLTVEQIPPLTSIGKPEPGKKQEGAPSTSTTTTTTQ